MLDPQIRLLYLEELCPPEGYVLDRAIATTFSLDLLSLLMAPLAMVLSEYRNKDDLLKDPVAVLEALRRTTDRLAIFCQQGRIAVPRIDTRLFSYLEPIVVEVQPDRGNGVFHPKIWLLRFTAEDEPVLYRLLCLSRNLTFDRSWDTILTLEGFLEDRKRGFSRNRPLADFITALPTLAVGDVSQAVAEHIHIIADEVRRVRFQPPWGFDGELGFIPSGIPGYRKQPGLNRYDRLLVVSPFLTDGWLKQVADCGRNNVLISRLESLDGISHTTLDRLEANTRIYIMEEAAERPDDLESEEAASSAKLDSEDLSGLHAKLYIAEGGWYARLLTGSANATRPAFGGGNVEFMVELNGKRSQVGIERFLGDDNDRTAFHTMLRPYRRSGTPPAPDEAQRKLERTLENARQGLSRAGLSLTITPSTDETFALHLKPASSFSIDEPALWGKCYPISLKPASARDIGPLLEGDAVTFENVSMVGLTGFFAFELVARHEDQEASVAFVLNLPVRGMPAERDKHILRSIISDRSRFIRYLLFLLAEGSEMFSPTELLAVSRDQGDGNGSFLYGELPLLEELVRAYSRQPEKIDRIARLIDDLRESDEGRALLPEGFEQIWQAFLAARDQEASA
jgi:hypothetical protein